MYKVQDNDPAFSTKLLILLYEVGILLTCGRYLHDHITLLRREAWAHNTSLILLLSTLVHVTSQERDQSSCVLRDQSCVLRVSILPLFLQFFYYILELF